MYVVPGGRCSGPKPTPTPTPPPCPSPQPSPCCEEEYVTYGTQTQDCRWNCQPPNCETGTVFADGCYSVGGPVVCPDGYEFTSSETYGPACCPSAPTPTPTPDDEGGGGGGQYCPEQQYPCQPAEWWSEEGCRCVCNPMYCTLILIDTAGDGFRLSAAADGIALDLTGDGSPERIAWTLADSDDSWLALDRNGNGLIDGGAELFGGVTPQPASDSPNGFRALAVFDGAGQGGNGDGQIDRRDAVFPSLRLWRDANHNGVSEAGELHTLPGLGLKSIDLDYRESKRRDEHGNWFRYRAKVRDARGHQLGRWAWDVILNKTP